MQIITAQAIYDERDEFAQFSGTAMHALFEEVLGEPSPAGRTPISVDALIRVAGHPEDTDARRAARAVLRGLNLV